MNSVISNENIEFLKWYHRYDFIKDEEFKDWVDSVQHEVKDVIEFYNYKNDCNINIHGLSCIIFLERLVNEYLENNRTRSAYSAFTYFGQWNMRIIDADFQVSGGNIKFNCERTTYGNAHYSKTLLVMPKWTFDYLKNGKLTYLSRKHISFEYQLV